MDRQTTELVETVVDRRKVRDDRLVSLNVCQIALFPIALFPCADPSCLFFHLAALYQDPLLALLGETEEVVGSAADGGIAADRLDWRMPRVRTAPTFGVDSDAGGPAGANLWTSDAALLGCRRSGGLCH